MNDTDLDRLASLYATLADPNRLRILSLLADGPATGADLGEALGLTPPTVSHHMSKLARAGLVQSTRDGAKRIHSLRHSEPDPAAAPDSHGDETDRFFVGDRLTTIPAQRKKRVAVLRRLMERFEPGRRYLETEVNALLSRVHPDVATLRRELVNYGFLSRTSGMYRVSADLPERGATVAQEVGDDEAAWFRDLVGAATREAMMEALEKSG